MDFIIIWFSCGAASAVAAKFTIDYARRHSIPFIVANCDIKEEHPDGLRFLQDCEKWFGVPVTRVGNNEYGRSIYNVFWKRRYIAGKDGAPCTQLLKKRVREMYQSPTDTHVLGYTSDEAKRVNDFIDNNPDVDMFPILVEEGITKADTLSIIERVGIEPHAMYQLGYKNANCIGCVKGKMGYWNRIRIDWPEVFDKMASVERTIGHSICKWDREEKGPDGERIRWSESCYLDKLPEGAGRFSTDQPGACGFTCEGAVERFGEAA